MTYVMLILGFVLLIKGADFFVEGSSAVARKLHIPAMVIGMKMCIRDRDTDCTVC